MHPLLKNFLQGLPSLPRRRSYLRSDRLDLATGRFGMAELVLSRALCRFQRFDLARLPANKRQSALSLQLPQWSPYQDSDYAVAWRDGVASVWCWDASLVETALSKLGRKSKSLRKLPESLLREPQAEGLRVVACLEGFEGQYWQATQLMASRWWPQMPDRQALLAFQRECHLSPEQQQTEVRPQECALASRPWAEVSGASTQDTELSLLELSFYGLLAVALGVPAMALGLQQYRVSTAIDARKAEIAQMGEQSRPLLDARAAALAALAKVKAIDGLQRFPPPLMLMVAIARALPEGEAVLKEWEMSEGKLKILVSSPEASIAGATYVSALEQSRLFTDIKIITQPDPKLMGFVMAIQTQDALGSDAVNTLPGR